MKCLYLRKMSKNMTVNIDRAMSLGAASSLDLGLLFSTLKSLSLHLSKDILTAAMQL